MPAAAFALCAKCDVAVRDRSDALCAAFAETLAVEDARVRRAALRVHARRRTTTIAWLAGSARADAVVAFGGDSALRAIRERTRPAGALRRLRAPHERRLRRARGA